MNDTDLINTLNQHDALLLSLLQSVDALAASVQALQGSQD